MIFYWVLGAVLLVFLYQVICFIILPIAIGFRAGAIGHKAAISKLTKVAKLPGVRGDSGKAVVFYALGELYFNSRQYKEASAWFERMMQVPKLPVDYAPPMHGRYADCCEVLGRPDQAALHRTLAMEAARRAPLRFNCILEIAEQTDLLGQFDRSYTEVQWALDTAKLPTANRNQLRCRIAGSALRAGRPEVVIRAAESGNADKATGQFAAYLNQLAGIACLDLGDRDRAFEFMSRTLEAATARKSPRERADALTNLSMVARSRGKLEEAIALGREAIDLRKTPSIRVRIIMCQTLILAGRHPEALEVISAPAEDVHSRPDHIRVNKSVMILVKARLRLEMGATAEASAHWEEALANLPYDTLRRTIAGALGAVIWAQRGRLDECRSTIAEVEALVKAGEYSRGPKIEIYADLCRASCILGDHGACLGYMARVQELKPYPTEIPRTLYFAASSCIKAGDRSRAIALYKEAAASFPESAYAFHSRQRLGELEAVGA